ncbi:hypothetical protein VTK26DRAFT_1005 [Humicola hyalothermophila]
MPVAACAYDDVGLSLWQIESPVAAKTRPFGYSGGSVACWPAIVTGHKRKRCFSPVLDGRCRTILGLASWRGSVSAVVSTRRKSDQGEGVAGHGCAAESKLVKKQSVCERVCVCVCVYGSRRGARNFSLGPLSSVVILGGCWFGGVGVRMVRGCRSAAGEGRTELGLPRNWIADSADPRFRTPLGPVKGKIQHLGPPEFNSCK